MLASVLVDATVLTVGFVLSVVGLVLLVVLTFALYRRRPFDRLSWLAFGVVACGAASIALRSSFFLT